MSTQKGFSTAGLVLIIALVILGAWYMKTHKKAEAPIDESKQQVAMASCGLTVSSPLSNTTVAFPLTMTAVVDNTNASELGCSWTVFEAQAGVVKVMNGVTEVGMGLLMTASDWMTVSPVTYTANITLSSAVVSGTPLTLVIEEENPSGEGTPSTIVIPVVAQ